MEGGGKSLLFTSTASGSQILDMKPDCWSRVSATVTKEGDEEIPPTATKSQTFQEAAPGKEAASTEAEGGFIACEVEEQQAVRVETQPPK